MLAIPTLPTATPSHAPVEAISPTRSRLVGASASADRLLALLLEIETMSLVQTMTLRAGKAELMLIAGFGKLLEVVDARLPVAGWEYQPPRHARQVAHLLCTLIGQPEAIEIIVQRGAAAWSRKAQGWTVGELRGACRRLMAARDAAGLAFTAIQDKPAQADSSSRPAEGAAIDDFVEAVSSYCRAVLKVRSDGTPARTWGDGDVLAQMEPQIVRDMARWLQATTGILPSRQFILLRPEAYGTCIGLLVEGAQTTVFVFDSPRTGLLSTAASRYLGRALA